MVQYKCKNAIDTHERQLFHVRSYKDFASYSRSISTYWSTTAVAKAALPLSVSGCSKSIYFQSIRMNFLLAPLPHK